MKEKIQQLIQEHVALHIECSKDIALKIEDIVSEYQNMSILSENMAMYEDMKVKEYLRFFADISQKREFIEQAIEYMHLTYFLHLRIAKCTLIQKRRILIAREIIKDCDIYCLEEPMKDLNEESIHMILHWFEIAKRHHKKIITISRSFKDICLCDGYKVYIRNDHIQPIEQEENIEIDDDTMVIQKISVKLNNRIFLLNPEDIDYVEAYDGKSQVYVRGSCYQSPFSMDELENRLHRFGFYRCHRSYLVNMQRVTQIVKWTRNSYSLKLINYEDSMIPLSKLKIQEMKTIYQF